MEPTRSVSKRDRNIWHFDEIIMMIFDVGVNTRKKQTKNVVHSTVSVLLVGIFHSGIPTACEHIIMYRMTLNS